jgi:predicted metalloendopeptidase
LNFGQIWCTNQTEQIERLRALGDPHSLPKYRVNGVVRNMPEFRETWNCKEGQPMAPESACRVW